MHDLPTLIIQSKHSSERMKELEQAIDTLIRDIDNYSTLDYLLSSGIECQFYCTIVIERRLKILVKTPNCDHNISSLVNFMNNMFSKCENLSVLNKLAVVYALSILYFFPKHNPDFFGIILNAVESGSLVGYLVIREYLFMLNMSTEITSDRRGELKNAGKGHIAQIVTLLLNRYTSTSLECHDQSILSIVVEIFTNALPHVKELHILLTFVCAVGLQKNVTLNFFNQFLTLNTKFIDNIDKIITFAMKCEPSFGYDILFILSTCKIDLKCKTLHDSIFWLLDSGYFILAINFLCKIYKREKMDENYTVAYLNKVSVESHKIYSQEDQSSTWIDYDPEEYTLTCIKSRIEEFIRLAASKTPKSVTLIQAGALPNRLATLILNIYPNTPVYNVFLQCYQSFLKNTPPDIVLLDLSDPEACKLALSCINKFKYPFQTLLAVVDKARVFDHVGSDDLVVTASILAGKMTGTNYLHSLITGFDDISLRRLVIFVKRDYKGVISIIPNFMAKFEECKDLKFLPLIGMCLKCKIPVENVLHTIYNCSVTWPYDDLVMVINNILNYTDEQATQTFIKLILNRMKAEEESGIVGRCFLNVIERRIANAINTNMIFDEEHGLPFYCSVILELLDIHDTFLIRRISSAVSNYNLELNFPLTVYKLLVLYNADDIPDAQPEILRFLAEIIPKMNDLSVFLQVNKTHVEIQSLRDALSPKNKKNNMLLLKEFLKNIKGANFRSNALTVGTQINKQNKSTPDMVDVSDFFQRKQG